MAARILCLIVGYLCGMFQTAYIYGLTKHKDIRKYGSGNAGTTNALRVFGTKAGALVFVGDYLKAVVACLLGMLIAKAFGLEQQKTLFVIYAGFGCILGHDFPFYLNFKGGKGIAASAGIITMVDIRIALVCLVLFAGITLITRYVSLASLVMITAFALLWIVFSYTGVMATLMIRPEADFLILIMVLLAFYQHRTNISRLARGKENKIGQHVEPKD